MRNQPAELSKSRENTVSSREPRRSLTLIILVVLAALAASPATAQSYTCTTLQQYANAINTQGQVVGAWGFLWTPAIHNGTSGSAITLPPLPGPSTAYSIYDSGLAINSLGSVAGVTVVATNKVSKSGFVNLSYFRTATVWQNGIPSALKTPNGADSYAYGINDSGDVVGVINNGATLWHNGTPVKLSTHSNYTSTAWSINGSGQVVGTTNTGTVSLNASSYPVGYATLWQNGAAYDLGVLPTYNQSSWARAMNRSGQVVGAAWSIVNGVPVSHAFLWTPATPNGTTGQMVDLGTLPGIGLESSHALGINASGQVVGFCGSYQSNYAAVVPFIWDSLHGMRDLNTLIPAGTAGADLGYANGINDLGQIVGGNQAGFLLTPQ
jgi:probable HAF family extracellular repeat protein